MSVMALLMVGIGTGAVWAAEESDQVELQTRLFGMGSYEFGQIVMGQYAWAKNITETNKGRLDHYWNQQGLLQIGVAVKGNNGLSMTLAGEGAMLFPYSLPSDGSGFGFDYLQARFKWYPSQLEGDYSLVMPTIPILNSEWDIFHLSITPTRATSEITSYASIRIPNIFPPPLTHVTRVCWASTQPASLYLPCKRISF
jgi:hypothetical protein